MKKREFNKILNQHARTAKGKRSLDAVSLAGLPLETRQSMGHFIIRNRGPVLVCLTEGMPEPWLNAMGYLHTTTSPTTGLVFRHTSAHTIL